MDRISSIEVTTPPKNPPKIRNAKDICGEVYKVIYETLKNNPQATDDELRAAIRNGLQGRISPKKLAQLNSDELITMVRTEFNNVSSQVAQVVAPATVPAANIPAANIRANYMPIEQKATHYYYEELPTTKEGWKHRHNKQLQDVKSAFGNNQEYLDYLKRNAPNIYEEEIRLIEQPQVKESNSAGKKQANSEYVSSKKRKAEKKNQVAVSKNENKQQRPIKDKAQRNARYVTEQNGMTRKARTYYNRVNKASQQFINRSEGAFHSAEESAAVFIENGLTSFEKNENRKARTYYNRVKEASQQFINRSEGAFHSAEESAAVFIENGLTSFEKNENKHTKGKNNLSNIPSQAEVVRDGSAKAHTQTAGAKNNTISTTPTPKPSKPNGGGKGGSGGNGKYWLIAAIAIGLSSIGYGLYKKHKKAQTQE